MYSLGCLTVTILGVLNKIKIVKMYVNTHTHTHTHTDTYKHTFTYLLNLPYLLKDLCIMDGSDFVLLIFQTPQVITYSSNFIVIVWRVVSYRVMVYRSVHLRLFVDFFLITVRNSLRRCFSLLLPCKGCRQILLS